MMEDEQKHASSHAVQDELNKRFKTFLDNHWPHLQEAVGSLDGKITVMLWSMGAMLSMSSAVMIKVMFF